MSKTLCFSLALAHFAGISSSFAATQDFSYTGNFSGDADVQLITFTITAVSDVTLRSYSYAGGIMADGTNISAGGFDPIIALWSSAGDLIQEYDDGPGSVPSDPVTNASFDANLTLLSLSAGTYTVSIAQYANFVASSSLADGFTESDDYFTSAYGCSNGQFCDVTSDNRTSFWAFDVLGVDSVVIASPAAVPLPAGLPLILSGMLGVGLIARRNKSA